MTRKRVKLDFIENINARKASYKKRQKGFLKKAHELNTLCGVELAIAVYSPYHEEPKVFPNHEATTNTFTNFKELPELVQSKNMETQERNTKQRIKKIEDKLQKVRKENKIMELTNQMYELLNGANIPTNIHLNDINDLSYVINQRLKQIHDAIQAKAHEESSTSNAPQSIPGSIVSGGTNFERLIMAPLLVTDVTTTMASPMIAPQMSNLAFPPLAPQIDPSANNPSMSASVPMDNNLNCSFDIPRSPSFSQLLSLNDDEIMTLLVDTSFDINDQDPNYNNL